MKFSELSRVYDRLARAENESKRTKILSELFQAADKQTLGAIAHFTLGEVVEPQYSENLGIGPATIRSALSELSKKSIDEIDAEVRESGDISSVVASARFKRTDDLTVVDLWRRVKRTVLKGEDRLKLVNYIFTHVSSEGAKYFTRMVLNQMRINVGLGTLIRALSTAFKVEAVAIERAYALSNDIGFVAASARQGKKALERVDLSLFQPYQFMNAHRVENAAEIFNEFSGKKVAFEVKYDGARLQIHIERNRTTEVKFYSRRLNDDTTSLQDIATALSKAWQGGDAILEGEAVAFDPTLKKKQPFQAVLMRLGRVRNIEETSRKIPLVLYLFELVYHNGQNLMNKSQAERREMLKLLVRETERVKLTNQLVTDKRSTAMKFFEQAIKVGHEGLMAKDMDAPYVPGQRTDNWLKLKPAYETLDVVVVGGVWGTGRRRGLLSSLLIAVRDKSDFKTVGKVGAGLSEKTLSEITEKLKPKIIATRGQTVEIEPDMVIEVDFQDIQKTNRYRAGYALRIPRFKRERTDKSIREADTLERLKKLY